MKIHRSIPALLLVLLAATGAQAKCNVTLELKNANAREVTVLGNAKRDLKIEYQECGSNQTYTEHKDDIDVEPGVALQITLKH